MKPGLSGGGQPFPSPIVVPPQPQASLQSCASLMDIRFFPSLHSKPATGIPLGNNHLTQHQSHRLTLTYHRDTGPGVCLLFQKTPSSSSSSLPPSSFFLLYLLQNLYIPGLCAHEMKRRKKVSQFKNKHCSEPSLRKTQRFSIKDGIYPGSRFISKTYIQPERGTHEELSGSFLVQF